MPLLQNVILLTLQPAGASSENGKQSGSGRQESARSTTVVVSIVNRIQSELTLAWSLLLALYQSPQAEQSSVEGKKALVRWVRGNIEDF